MTLPVQFKDRLRLPLVVSPMFIASNPELVIEACKAGAVGTFPALNQRTSEGFETWLLDIKKRLSDWEAETGRKSAPFGVNLIVHKSNPRWQADLAICVKHKVPLVITSLGAVADLVEAVHGYGGIVFHDVVNTRHARKAADAGVDGLIAVCNGAGGHAGTTSPFALIAEIRQFFTKTLLLAGSLSNGRDIAAAEMMGADLAYMGTRFLATTEANVTDDYKQMLIDSQSADIVYTPKISGVNANFMRQSIEDAGIDPADLSPKAELDFGSELDMDTSERGTEKKAWRDIWSAGQGVGSIEQVQGAGELVDNLVAEYHQAVNQQHERSAEQFTLTERHSK
ncbi:NAD(P)H-dependent flavin oxidoreductase [Allohahella sp. A8]|uniref:NAD(P)H-dependent flavin oxidoreductase n=1 Tax=Allohahella sp. A8 TaxID=3141461 RepID=UPI003A804768